MLIPQIPPRRKLRGFCVVHMIEHLIKQLKEKAYKGRFSIYHREEETLVRIYRSDGSQRKFVGETLEEALLKAIGS